MWLLLGLLAVGAQTQDTMLVLQQGVRSPALSSDGRLAIELRGDLWIAAIPSGIQSLSALSPDQLQRVTSGTAWDREPAWTPDGSALLFSSDRAGNFDIWRVTVGPNGSTGTPQRLTSLPEPESEPAAGAGGQVAFVRGAGFEADIWILSGDSERQITRQPGAETSPAFSPGGSEIAYVAERNRTRRLVIKGVADGVERTVQRGGSLLRPAWSPAGDRIAYSTNAGVWLTGIDGSYSNLVSTTASEAAWTSDARHLVLAELPPNGPGYNGDPRRVLDRSVGDMLGSDGRLWIATVPPPPDADLATISIAAATSRTAFNAEVFDRVWTQLDELYYEERGGEAWIESRDRFRPAALDARGESELDDVIYSMLRQRPALKTEVEGRAAVSSAHSLATAAGVEILDAGGNVVDAAVAVSFALGVVEPDASGMAGYGEMVLYLEEMDRPIVIEFLTRVPEHASLSNAALLDGGRLPADGPVLANVPGTVAGMWTAWKKYGSGDIEWSRLLEPAIKLAEDGHQLDDAFTTTLSLERERFLKYEGSRRLFFPGGEPLQPGDTLRNPDLAWTLRQVAERGADGFYKGPVARRLVSDLRGHGNAITMEDLARYYAVEREPIQGTYRGHTVYSSVPAASGGTSLVSKLNLLEQYDDAQRYTEHAGTLHAMIEAWKLQPSSQGRIADPSLWPVDVAPLLNKDSARVRWERCFDAARSTGPTELERGSNRAPVCAEEVASVIGEGVSNCAADLDDVRCRATGTTAFAVGDERGNMVAVTQTLGTWGGNFYVSPGLGFLYNDKLRSYSTNPAAYNSRLPFARNGTSIAPTLIFRGTQDDQRPMVALGVAGNAWITSGVYQIAASMMDADLSPQQALEMPRFLVGVRRDPNDPARVREIIVQIEDAFSPEVMRELSRIGHEFQRISVKGELRMGYGAAVRVDGGRARAGADPRRSGAAGAVR